MTRLELFDGWRRLALKMANRTWYSRRAEMIASGFELADVEQIALLALHRATGGFDASLGFSFGTYAGVFIRNDMLSLVKSLRRLSTLSDVAGEYIAADESDCGRSEIDREKLDDTTAKLLDSLPKADRAMLRRRVAGETFKRIGRRYGVSKQRVMQRCGRSLSKLRAGREFAE